EGLAFQTRRFDASDTGDGIRRAVAWLDSAPPARRELVVAGPLTLGSINAADIALVPTDVGVRFERTSSPPPSRVVTDAVLARTGVGRRGVPLAGGETTVRDEPGGAAPAAPIEIAAPGDLRHTADAALAAVLSARISVPPPDRRARLELVGGGDTRRARR